MVNIGYAVFKQSKTFIIDSNGMFETLQLEEDLVALTNKIKLQNEVGQNVLCFKRIGSKIKNKKYKDAYLVIIIERIKNNTEDFIIGSAICFKEFQVNEDKIIKGVQYLLSQLKRNFQNDNDIDNDSKELGVILPSTNKDFKIFKGEKLVYKSVERYVTGYNLISTSNDDAEMYLHHFCTNTNLSKLELFILVSSIRVFNDLEKKGDDFIKVNYELLKNSNLEVNKTPNPSLSKIEDDKINNDKLTTITEKLTEERKRKNSYKYLSIFLFSVLVVLAIMFFIGNKEKVSYDNSIYPIEDNMYISNNAYNVNVRSTPRYSPSIDNLKTTLSDGDEVFVIGFDKQSLWAKISYNEGSDTGYVSNRYISKYIDKSRVEQVNKTAKIRWTYDGVTLYAFPQDNGFKDPNSRLIILDEDNEVFVKNRDLKRDWYSVRFKKNNKIYNGFLQRKDFEYQ